MQMIVVLLGFVYWRGGDAPSLRGWEPQRQQTDVQIKETADMPQPEKDIQPDKEPDEKNDEQKEVSPKKEQTQAPLPVETKDTQISDKPFTCTLSVRCDTVLSNIEWLDESKTGIVPKDGVIFPETTVSFYEGESVFNLLLREMKRNKIHLEYVNTPVYNSAYIEETGNLYEFDCGELSGWMYKVNGVFPNYGSSRYQLKDGDRIEWAYTSSLGENIGGGYTARNGK